MGLDPGFLSLLQGRVPVESFTGEDSWGNNTYAAPVVQQCFIESITQVPGSQDGQNRQDGPILYSAVLIMDAVGVAVKDRITLPNGLTAHVTQAETGLDEIGGDLYQTVTVITEPRG